MFSQLSYRTPLIYKLNILFTHQGGMRQIDKGTADENDTKTYIY